MCQLLFVVRFLDSRAPKSAGFIVRLIGRFWKRLSQFNFCLRIVTSCETWQWCKCSGALVCVISGKEVHCRRRHGVRLAISSCNFLIDRMHSHCLSKISLRRRPAAFGFSLHSVSCCSASWARRIFARTPWESPASKADPHTRWTHTQKSKCAMIKSRFCFLFSSSDVRCTSWPGVYIEFEGGVIF